MRRVIHRVATRQGAAFAAYLGLWLLAAGFSLPVLSVGKFGDTVAYSLLGSIATMAGEGEYLLAGLIFLFSVVFPTVKLVATLLVSLGAPGFAARTRWRLISAFNRLGKYSMLDVFVIAVFIVVFKIRGILDAEVAYGFYFFVAGILVSIVSTGMLLSHMPDAGTAMANGNGPRGAPAAPEGGAGPRRVPRLYLLVLAGGVVLLALAGTLAVLAPPGEVDRILVQKRPGVDLQIVSLPDAPDYKLEIRFKGGPTYTTETRVNTPIGNGIVFDMPAIEISQISEIVLWDDNSLDVSNLKLKVIPDEIVDRVRVDGERSLVGERMRFDLLGARSDALIIAYVLLAVAAAAILGAGALLILRFGRAQAG